MGSALENGDKYAVKKRIECRRVAKRNVPVNGPYIGYIIDGAYVLMKRIGTYDADLRDWVNVAYCDSLFKDIIE